MNTLRRGVPCGRPIAFQRRITLYYCRSYSPIGHPQGAPLRWVCLVFAFDFMHERHEWRDVSYMNKIVLFVYSCRNENILIIRCHPNSLKNTHRRGVPCGRPVAFQRRITLYYCRSYSPIGHPQGAPLRWMCSDCKFDFMHERHEINDEHPLQGRPLWLPGRLSKANNFILLSVLQPDRAPTRDAPAVGKHGCRDDCGY